MIKARSTPLSSLTSPPNPLSKSKKEKNKDKPKEDKQQTRRTLAREINIGRLRTEHTIYLGYATNEGVVIIICKVFEGHRIGRRRNSVRCIIHEGTMTASACVDKDNGSRVSEKVLSKNYFPHSLS